MESQQERLERQLAQIEQQKNLTADEDGTVDMASIVQIVQR